MAQTPNNSSGASSMAELMARYNTPVVSLKKGETVKGTITKLTRGDIRVDVQAKSEAIVLEKDRQILNSLMAALHVGDEVDVTVLNAESDTGNPVVSLRRFIGDKSWDKLAELQKNKEQIDVTVTEATKGGYVVVTESGMSGFLPNSHTSFQSAQVTVGNKLPVTILELNRKDNKIIVSQKSQMTDEDFAALKKTLKSGEKVNITVANITPFGLFVNVPVPGKDEIVDGLIHISEIAWEKVDDLSSLYTVGQTADAQVIGFDNDAKRIDLSIKRLSEDPFTKIAERYPVESRVKGTVLRIGATGVTVELDGTEAIIRKEKIPANVSYKVGDSVTATVTEVDAKHHRILLTPVLLEKPIGYR